MNNYRNIGLVLSLLLLWLASTPADAANFLFDATKAETAGNADWVIDEDNHLTGRIPTPDAASITSATPETYWTGALSTWGVSLVQLGHTVESLPVGGRITYLDTTNPQDLSHYEVYIVCEPNIRFTAAEKTALARYVQDGGSLFVISDHTGSDRNNDGADSVVIWNDFFTNNGVQANPFGVSINSTNISQTSSQVDTAADDPFTNGPIGPVSQLKYSAGATLTINPTANPSVRAAFWSGSSHTNSNVMVAYGSFGAGRFAVVGDSSPSDDGTGSSGHTLYYGWTELGVNHPRLFLNASVWLASRITGNGPYNDAFANAIQLDPGVTVASGSNVGATKENGEPNHAGVAGGASIWWQFTAANSGTATLSTQGSSFATVVAVYTGNNVAALSLAAANANGQVGLPVSAGLTYRIAVDGVGGATGQVQLNLTLPGPGNDIFSNAAPISFTESPVSVAGNNFNATAESGEHNHAASVGGRSVWWRWTAAATGPVIISTVGSSFDTLLAVYTGTSVSNLTSVVSNANYDSLLQSQLTLNAIAGTTYQIAVDGYLGAAGAISLSLSPAPSTTPPVNDNFANASPLSGLTVRATATTTNATTEPGEPANARTSGGHSVWWRWTAPGNGIITVTTVGSNFDTTLGVYSGAVVNALTEIVGNDDSGGNYTSMVTMLVAADTTYNISVDGYGGESGSVVLNLAYTQGNNDNFSGATPLNGVSVNATGVNINATLENGEAVFLNGGHSVWWRWTAPSDLVVSVVSDNGIFDSSVEIYTGDTIGALRNIPYYNNRDSTREHGSNTSFIARAGIGYFIRVDGVDGRTGPINLSLRATPFPVISMYVGADSIKEGITFPTYLVLQCETQLALPITIPLVFGGTATVGTDYACNLPVSNQSTAVTIYAGMNFAYVEITALPDNDPTEGNETITASLVAGIGYQLDPAASTQNFTLIDDSPYTAAWEATYRPLGFSGITAAPTNDSDGDGLSNLVEFALNLNPLAGDSPAYLPTLGSVSLTDAADGLVHRYATLTFVRRTDAPNISYTVEGTANLGGSDWSISNVVFISSTSEGAVPNTERAIYRSASPLDGSLAFPAQFLRLRITNLAP